MDRKSISIGVRLSAVHYVYKVLLCKKLSNKQSGYVIFRPVRLITL